MKMKKRLLSILLSLALVLGLMPGMSLTAYAATTYASGSVNISALNAGDILKSGVTVTAKNGTPGFRVLINSTRVTDYLQSYTTDKNYSVKDAGEIGMNDWFIDLEPIAHNHSFTYAASGATITATCSNTDDCPLSGSEYKATLTIAAPTSLSYDGTAKAAVITDANSIKGTAKVQYKKKTDGSYGTATETAPTDAGEYKASITLGEGAGAATASVEYTTAPTGLTATYGQTLTNVTLPNGWTWLDAATTSVGTVGNNIFKADFAGNDNYNAASNVDVTVTVNKAANPATVAGTATVIKGGNTVDLAGNVTKNGATGDVSYEISGEPGGCSLNGSVLTSGDTTGTVTVNVTVAEDDNYAALTATPITVTINDKGTQTITAENVTASYGDTDKKVNASVTEPTTGGGAISYAVKDGSADYIDVNASTGVLTIKKVPADGKAYVIVTAAETSTYTQATKEVTVTVNKANAVPATVTANNRTYDGTEKPLVSEDKSTLVGGTMQYALGTATEATEPYTTSIPTATNAGTYYVWYKAKGDENHTDSEAKPVEVKISEAITPIIKFDVTELSLKPEEEKSITATVVPENTKVTWTSDKESVATVDDNGKVKAVSDGTATITGKITVDDKEYTAECKVTVTKDAPVVTPSIKFDVTELSLKPEEEKTITETVVPENTKVTWTSDNEAVATVDANGKVKAVSSGTATITGKITVDGKDYSAECKVTVAEDKPEPTPTDTGVTISVSEMQLYPGSEKAFTVKTVPEGVPVTWSSSDMSVAYVTAGGVVTGLKPGTAVITATITVDGKEYSASCKVTVVPAGTPIIYPTGGGEHTHNYVWKTIEATEDADGELRYQCETCGDIQTRVPLTAYNVFNKNTTEKIRNAKKDATVRIETNKWISFHKMVMEALAERPDVTLEISFLDAGHKGNRCTVVIPKGTDTKSLVDKNGFTGFLFLGGKFGMKTQ